MKQDGHKEREKESSWKPTSAVSVRQERRLPPSTHMLLTALFPSLFFLSLHIQWACELCTKGQMSIFKSCWTARSSDCWKTFAVHAARVLWEITNTKKLCNWCCFLRKLKIHCYADNVCDKNICVHLEKCKTETHHCGLRCCNALYLPQSIYTQRTSKNTHTLSFSLNLSQWI